MAAAAVVNVGTQANDATGDLLRDAFTKINTNFAVLFSGTFPAAQLVVGPPPSGVALTVNGFTSQPVASFVAATGSAAIVRLTDGQAGNTIWSMSAGVSAAGDFNLTNNTASTTPIKVTAAGAITLTGAVNAATSLAVSGTPVLTSAVTTITGTANQVAVSASTGAVTVSIPQNTVIPTPATGTALAVNGVGNANSLVVTGSATSGQSFGVRVLAGTNASDVAVEISPKSGATDYLLILGDGSGNIGPSSSSGLSWTAAGVAKFSSTLGINGNAPPAQVTGWGTPVGNAAINNYNITDAGGANSNTNKAVAQIIATLKAFGLFGT